MREISDTPELRQRLRNTLLKLLQRNGYTYPLKSTWIRSIEREILEELEAAGELERRRYRTDKRGYPNNLGRSERDCWIRPGGEKEVRYLTLLPKRP
jgi:hypothetical protein